MKPTSNKVQPVRPLPPPPEQSRCEASPSLACSPSLSVGVRVKVVSHSCYQHRLGIITHPNGAGRWMVSIDEDDDFEEVSFHESELLIISENHALSGDDRERQP